MIAFVIVTFFKDIFNLGFYNIGGFYRNSEAEKMDVSDSKIEENSTQNESKGDLDITVDSVKDHLA